MSFAITNHDIEVTLLAAGGIFIPEEIVVNAWVADPGCCGRVTSWRDE